MSNFKNITKKKLIAIIALIVVVVAIPLTVIISQQQQDVRQRASGNETSFYFSQTDENTPITQVALGNNQQTTAILYLDTKGQVINAFDVTIDAENNPDLIRINSFQEGEGAIQFENEVIKTQTAKKVQISKLTTDTNKIIMGKLKIGSVTFTTVAEGQGTMRVKDIVITSPLKAGASLTADTPSLAYTIEQATPTPAATNTPAPVVPGTVSLTLSPSTINITQPTEQDFTATYTMAGICSSTKQTNGKFELRDLNNSVITGEYDGIPITKRIHIEGNRNACGSNNPPENVSLRLDCSRSSVICSGNTLVLNVRVLIKTPGNYKGYLKYEIENGVDTGWQESGTVVTPPTPTPVPATPTLDPQVHIPVLGNIFPQTANITVNTFQTFTATISDTNGYSDLKNVGLKFLDHETNYSPELNRFYTSAGNCVSGENKILETNNNLKLDCSKSSAVGSGNDLNITWEIAARYSRRETSASLYAEDKSGYRTGLQTKGGPYTFSDSIPTVPPTATPLPTATPSPTPTNTPTPIPGTATPTPSVTYLAEDVNRSGCVDLMDFNILLSAIRSGSAQTGTYPDINNNGTIDIFDFNLWLNAFRAGRGRCQ